MQITPPLVRLGNLFPERSVWAKCEFLAPSGSFKMRGAEHLLDHLERTTACRELVVPSMGNTALAAAWAGKQRGFRVTAVVPPTIGRAKEEKLCALGTELVKVSGGGTALLEHAEKLAGIRSAYFVHPHLDRAWTDGYGPMLAEILSAVPDCKLLLVPIGGGGLLMGLTQVLSRQSHKPRLIGVEPFNYPTYATFHHVRSTTIADGLVLENPHPSVVDRIKDRQIGFELIGEEDIRKAMYGLYEKQGLMVEPSSAITVALLQKQVDFLEPACVILTGRNITDEDFADLAGAR